MFSGKTNLLIQKVVRAQLAHQKVVVYRPETDTRTAILVSRSGLEAQAADVRIVNRSSWIGVDVLSENPDLVVIDEAQFFDSGIIFVVDRLVGLGYHVIVAGLDRDFQRRPFGSMPTLLTMADEVTKLTAICHTCRGEATLTQRLVDGRPASPRDPLVLIGGMGDETYQARCHADWQVS